MNYPHLSLFVKRVTHSQSQDEGWRVKLSVTLFPDFDIFSIAEKLYLIFRQLAKFLLKKGDANDIICTFTACLYERKGTAAGTLE